MSDETEPGNETFSADDLAPSPADQRARRRAVLDKVVAAVATLALGGWAGGLVVVHGATVPAVMEQTPAVVGGRVLATMLMSFDQLALGCAATALGCEVVRTGLAWGRVATIAQRIRRYLAILLAAAMAYVGLVLTPQIAGLVKAGATPTAGPDSPEISRLLDQAELLGMTTIALAAGLIALHLFTLPGGGDEDDEPAVAPLPPGPAQGS